MNSEIFNNGLTQTEPYKFQFTESHRYLYNNSPILSIDRAKVIRKIKQHSFFVRLMRICLPFLSIVIIFALSVVNNSVSLINPGFELNEGSLSLKGGSIVMNSPKLSGFGDNGQSYEVGAKTASQSIMAPQIIKLEELLAKITLKNGTWARVQSANGIYDTKNTTLTLNNAIQLEASNGYSMILQNAVIDLKANVLTSTDSVEVKSKMGFLQANKLIVDQSGQRIIFTDRVRLTIAPPQSGGSLIISRP